MMKQLLIGFFLVISSTSYSQVNTDSLWKVWSNTKNHDTIRLSAIALMTWKGFMFVDQYSAFTLASIQYDFAEKKKNLVYMAIARNSQGVSRALKGRNKEALKYFEECVEINIEARNVEMAANILNNIGLIHKNEGDYIKAIDYYTQSRKIREKEKDTTGIINSLNNISVIYIELNDHDNAVKLLNRSLQLTKHRDDVRSEAITWNNFGRLYADSKEPQKAVNAFKKANVLFKQIGDTRSVALLLGNLGVVFKEKGDTVNALHYLNQSLETGEKIGDKEATGQAQAHLADIYKATDPDKALELARKARQNALDVNSRDIQQVSAEVLYKTLKNLGDSDEALKMYEVFIELRDSLRSEENLREVTRQHYKYEYDMQAVQDSVAHAKGRKIDTIKIEKKNQQLTFLWIGLGLIIVFSVFIWNRFRIIRLQKALIEEQKLTVESANRSLGEKNREIVDSINYAKRIQSTIMLDILEFEEQLKDSFVFYLPKDIVAGDFYWLEKVDNKILFAAADCTGHGVPGAMVSLLCVNSLNRAVREHQLTSPDQILNKTRELVLNEFAKSKEEVNDGMDIALCCLKGDQLSWAGANNPLWIIRNGELIEYKADKQPVGKSPQVTPFTVHSISLKKNDLIYIFTDGFSDQFGSPMNKKYKTAGFKRFLLKNADKPISEQKEQLKNEFDSWKGDLEQLDDVCVIGFRF